jgi:hypothetical protein
MQIDNPFDRALEAQRNMPESLRTAATHTVDSLDLAWQGAKAVFGTLAKPEHALMLLPILLERADDERLQLIERASGRTGDEA